MPVIKSNSGYEGTGLQYPTFVKGVLPYKGWLHHTLQVLHALIITNLRNSNVIQRLQFEAYAFRYSDNALTVAKFCRNHDKHSLVIVCYRLKSPKPKG